jgi:AraC-like DNA-binding protein
MCSPIITQENFNPKIFYICKKKFTNPEKPLNPHKHDFIELRYVFSGNCNYILNGMSYPVKSGDLIICNPGVEHTNSFVHSKELTTEFHVGFTDIHLKNLPKNTLYPETQSPIIFIPSNHRQEFVKCCYEILSEYDSKKQINDLMIKSLVMKLLVLLIRELYPEQKTLEDTQTLGYEFESSNKTYVVNTIITYLTENYARKISLSKISQNMYLSPVYISKLFKEETGESPINYLIQLRLEKAKEILAHAENPSIKDIAKSVGYDDAYYFSKLFKKYYGVSPSNYKK